MFALKRNAVLKKKINPQQVCDIKKNLAKKGLHTLHNIHKVYLRNVDEVGRVYKMYVLRTYIRLDAMLLVYMWFYLY